MRMDLELRHLRYFLAVAEELHFRRAAERLRMSQPPLSQQIKQLEAQLGFELFARTRRRVALTAAGRAFAPGARAVLDRLEQAAREARRVAQGESGALAVGFVASATYALVPRLYRIFRQRHPGVELTLVELSTAEQLEALASGRIQVGIGRPPVTEDVTATLLAEEPILAALPHGHPLARRRTVPLASLAAEPFVFYPRRPRPNWLDVLQAEPRAAGFRPPVAQEVQELSTALTLVAARVGVTLAPASAAALRLAGVVFRPLAAPAPTTRLLALHRPDGPTVLVARLLAVAREVLRARAGRG
ncbi:MAG: LysR substrate-binding domain-containing protein [Anaeromyxobacter sp.]